MTYFELRSEFKTLYNVIGGNLLLTCGENMLVGQQENYIRASVMKEGFPFVLPLALYGQDQDQDPHSYLL